jgi:SprT protein
MSAAAKVSLFDDLWQPAPGGALPTRQTLLAIAQRCGVAWEMPDLAPKVAIRYNGRLRTSLGWAVLEEGRVDLNTRLLLEHPAELIPTLVHELAHLAIFRRYGRVSPHGMQFRTFMRAVRLSAKATHDLPVESLRRRRFLYLHRCTGCGYTFIARRPRRDCYCRACGPPSKWRILRAPATAEGKGLLEKARHAGR